MLMIIEMATEDGKWAMERFITSPVSLQGYLLTPP